MSTRFLDVEALVQRRSLELEHSLCDEDYNLLVSTMERIIPEMIDKFIKGAIEHPYPLTTKATTRDILSELYDGIFYTTALEKRHENKQ